MSPLEGIRGYAEQQGIARSRGYSQTPRLRFPPEQALNFIHNFLALSFPLLAPTGPSDGAPSRREPGHALLAHRRAVTGPAGAGSSLVMTLVEDRERWAALVEAAQRGDATSWPALIDRFEDIAVASAVGLCGDLDEAADIAQDGGVIEGGGAVSPRRSQGQQTLDVVGGLVPVCLSGPG